MNNNYKKWDNIRGEFQDFAASLFGIFIDGYTITESNGIKTFDLLINGTTPLHYLDTTDENKFIWHVPKEWTSGSKVISVTRDSSGSFQLGEIQLYNLYPGDWVVLRQQAVNGGSGYTEYSIQANKIDQYLSISWSKGASDPGGISNKPSVEVTGNRVATITSNTTTTKYPTVGAVRDYVALELQSYVPDVSGKEDVSNKVTVWSTSIPEGETDPVIDPSDTKYPSEKLVYDFVNNNYQPVGNYLTAQDISGKEDTSNKVTTWSSTPSDSNYPSEKLVYDTIPTVMGASGNSHKGGLVPDTPSTAGTLKYLREDGTWSIPAFELTTVTGTNITQTLNPNIYYSFGTVSQLTISFANIIDGINNEYIFEFDSGSTATTLSIPASVIGINTTAIKANKHYEISIKYDASNLKYYGLIEEW